MGELGWWWRGHDGGVYGLAGARIGFVCFDRLPAVMVDEYACGGWLRWGCIGCGRGHDQANGEELRRMILP